MGTTDRQQTLLLWIIGALGVLVALALVGLLAWLLFLRPSSAPAPTPTAMPAFTPTAIGQATTMATFTMTPPPPTQPPATFTMTPLPPTQPPATATPTEKPSPAPTFTPTPVPPTSTLVPPTPTSAPPSPTPLLSPYGTINNVAANVRAGPGMNYPVIAQLRYGDQVLLIGRTERGDWLYVRLGDGRQGWIATYLVNVWPGLVLPVIQTPPPPTPPPPPLTPTPLPTIWYPTPPPTSTFTPMPIPPTSTFTPAPCPIPVGAPFVAPWTGEVRTMLGCPVEGLREPWTAIQLFERGLMFWREDQRMIYAITYDATWRKTVDLWREGMDEYSCPDEPPAGLVKPKRGFGYAWCNQPGLKSLIGWGLAEEHGYSGHFQAFAGGEMIRAEDGTVYILLRSGWWRRYP